MISTLLTFLGFLAAVVVYFFVTTFAIYLGTRSAIMQFAPVFFALMVNNQKEDDVSQDIIDILEAEKSGEIPPEEAAKILRNIRGEK